MSTPSASPSTTPSSPPPPAPQLTTQPTNGSHISTTSEDWSKIPDFIVASQDSGDTSKHVNTKGALRGGRTLILCFDGTGEKYGNDNSNIIKLFSLLKKDDKRKQLVYYQAGVGTYGHATSILGMTTLSTLTDFAIAWSIGMHIRQGYKFLMDNYQEGDRICLFGFSRGAYTARALAGMIHKVGLLAKDNDDQIIFAYKLYRDTTSSGKQLAMGFKQTFGIPNISIHFLGVFDTVSSVGMFGKTFPFDSAGDRDVRFFRHAMALDERRARFKNKLWERVEEEVLGIDVQSQKAQKAGLVEEHINRENVDVFEGQGKYRSLSNQDGTSTVNGSGGENGTIGRSSQVPTLSTTGTSQPLTSSFPPSTELPHHTNSLKSLFTAKKSKPKKLTEEEIEAMEAGIAYDGKKCDIEEVWFLGGHCDVGGGGYANDYPHMLSNIPLRWMIRETFKCNTGIIYSSSALKAFGMNMSTLYPFIATRPSVKNRDGEEYLDFMDCQEPIWDELHKSKGWYILELLPMKQWYIKDNKWENNIAPNLGRYRVILDQTSKFHRTVKLRMQEKNYQINALMNRGEELEFVE